MPLLVHQQQNARKVRPRLQTAVPAVVGGVGEVDADAIAAAVVTHPLLIRETPQMLTQPAAMMMTSAKSSLRKIMRTL